MDQVSHFSVAILLEDRVRVSTKSMTRRLTADGPVIPSANLNGARSRIEMHQLRVARLR